MTTSTPPAHLDHLTDLAAQAMEAAAALDAAAICNERCIDAVCEECTCACGGVNHGRRLEVRAMNVYRRRLATVGGDTFALLPTVADDEEWCRPVRRVVVVDEGAW